MGELDDILAQLEASLGALDGRPEALDGGITNRNYRVSLGGNEYVVRLPGKDTGLLGIDRTAERVATEAAARLGIAPAVAGALEGCLVTRFVTCRALAAGELADRVEEIAGALRAFHDSTTVLSGHFWVPGLLADYAAILRRAGRELPGAYESAASASGRIAAALPPSVPAPCHNDLLPGNIIGARDDGRLLIVDWEYAGMGDHRFDLGNLSVNNDFQESDDERLLRAYYGRVPSDGQRAALKLMRVLSDAREAAWGVIQGSVSELDFDFDGYAEEHFDRLLEVIETAAFAEWLAAAGEQGGGER